MTTAALPNDAGTNSLTRFPPPGSVDAAAKNNLSDQERDSIEENYRRILEEYRNPLEELQHLRDNHIRLKQEVLRERGPHSWGAAWEQATIDVLSALIEEAQSPMGRASEEVRKLLDAAEKKGSRVPDKDIADAVSKLLKIEQGRQLSGIASSDGTANSGAMELVSRAIDVGCKRKNEALEDLMEKAKRPGGVVRDDQIANAVREAIGAERQRQLMGGSSDDSLGTDFSSLLTKSTDLFVERKNQALKDLIQKAKKPGSAVNEEQIETAIREAFGAERQQQLMGGESNDKSTLNAVVEAMTVILDRKTTKVKNLSQSNAPQKDIDQANKEYDEAKKALQNMGGSLPDVVVTFGPPTIESRTRKDR